MNETLKHVSKRGAHRNHFEDVRLPVAQGVRQLALGNIVRNSGHADRFRRVVAQGRFRRQYQVLPPEPSKTYSSMSIMDCPVRTTVCSSSKNFCARSFGRT